MLGAATENALSPNFRRVLETTYSRRLTRRKESIRVGLRDISDCSQHASQVGWSLANSRFVHKEAQFIVDPLLDRQPVQLLTVEVLFLFLLSHVFYVL